MFIYCLPSYDFLLNEYMLDDHRCLLKRGNAVSALFFSLPFLCYSSLISKRLDLQRKQLVSFRRHHEPFTFAFGLFLSTFRRLPRYLS